ncbi:lipopolysaccharide heptosyltransferase 1 [Vibrio metoecus]|uniref:lipopolysaccharide heptosyltransferase RfaC n=1 Tax=Vibrio metoecus TaxID=1481663 RepID=UPI000BA8DD8D|nr:lipopolysaccharide heptosyltransferase RfaC [Vibrio metoecus]PAR55769.1 lipopolysaccharide heptosyltransferase 1 [Vibrio metoecus]
MRVLLVKTSSMGDVIHTLPALTDASKMIDGLRFDWVVEENFAQIPSWHTCVEHVIPVALRRWRKTPFQASTRKQWQHFREQVTQTHYDIIIDAQGLLKSAWLTRIPQAPVHGYDWSSVREPLASLFYQHKHHVSKTQHAVERIRSLMSMSLGYSLPNTMGDYAIAHHFKQNPNGHNIAPYCIFLHATTRAEKHWSENHWRTLIAAMKPLGIRVRLPWGAPHEQARAQRLASGFDHVDVLPRLTLSEIAAQLADATAIVSVDTGLSHLAAALDRPNITLYGPTDPGLIGGYGQQQHPLSASLLGSNDIQTLTPSHVLNVLEPILSAELSL